MISRRTLVTLGWERTFEIVGLGVNTRATFLSGILRACRYGLQIIFFNDII